MSFPAADVAADAVDKLKSSTVDSKELFVKVLPNIHVSIRRYNSSMEVRVNKVFTSTISHKKLKKEMRRTVYFNS